MSILHILALAIYFAVIGVVLSAELARAAARRWPAAVVHARAVWRFGWIQNDMARENAIAAEIRRHELVRNHMRSDD